tara:strand:+ start:116 stop:802 length:687 start_codon:yes stop_codon:yes gene_type:complete
MRKIIISAVIFTMATFSAIADKTNIGLKVTLANMDAGGTHSTDLGTNNNGGPLVTESREADFEMGSIFLERQFEDVGSMDIAVGIDLVPFTAVIDKIGGGTGFDASVEIGNLMTAYVQPMFNVDDNVSLFLKAGWAQADLDIVSSSRQAQASGQANDTAGTDTSASKTLEGPMFGAGVQIGVGALLDFVRLEATMTDFDEISHTNSNGKVLKADAELTQLSLSLVKSF